MDVSACYRLALYRFDPGFATLRLLSDFCRSGRVFLEFDGGVFSSN
jgi:hypothetical protein